MGTGVRVKKIGPAGVKVYAVGLYVDPKGAQSELAKHKCVSSSSCQEVSIHGCPSSGKNPQQLNKAAAVNRCYMKCPDLIRALERDDLCAICAGAARRQVACIV